MNTEVNVESKAKSMGWVPQEQFRGDPERWVDAETFVAKGEEMLPLLRADKRKLESDVEVLKRQNAELKQLFTSAQYSIEALKENATAEVKRRVADAKRDLQQQLVEAREAGDHGLAVKIEDQLADVREAQKEVAAGEKTSASAKPTEQSQQQQQQPALNPDYVAWTKDNPWFGQDKRKTALVMVIAEERRANKDPLVGRAFFDACAEEAENTLNPRSAHAKVEGDGKGGGGSGGGGGSNGAGSFRDLPADAKAQCDKQEVKMVGAGRAFKTQAEWRKYYADIYFAS